MMPIPFSEAQLTADEAFKQKAALQQMQDLLERIAVGKKYRTLTRADRRTLNQEGYAQDLIDHLVLVTQRVNTPGLDGKPYQDLLQTGFTYAAFDPSLYANASITRHLRATHNGCCAFCESFVEAGGAGVVTALRPQAIVLEGEDTLRSPYLAQAYAQNNLYYACPACSEYHKNGYFPVQGERQADPTKEQALLLAPYTDQPRDFIRFNPQNGRAYAYDRVAAFYAASQGLQPSAIEAMLWQDPSQIPLQTDAYGKPLSAPALDQQFSAWLASTANPPVRGQTSIDCLGLNRPALAASRQAQAVALQAEIAQGMAKADPAIALGTWLQTLLAQQLQYHSLNLDVVQTCLAQLVAMAGNTTSATVSPTPAATLAPATTIAPATTTAPATSAPIVSSTAYPLLPFPLWLVSSLMYMVLESELQGSGKRRLVNLCSDDSAYGADNPEKTLFLAVDWLRDGKNVIKVKSKSHIWETTFQELAASRPMEVRSLFANNQVWVEGDYPALA